MINISSDKSKLNIDVIYQFLTNSYWAKGRTEQAVKKSIANSMCFGVYKGDKQIGFARVVTDYTVFAYLMDVFIIKEYQGNGYAKQLVMAIVNEEELKACTVWMLKTGDAHGLYRKFGFETPKDSNLLMERVFKDHKDEY